MHACPYTPRPACPPAGCGGNLLVYHLTSSTLLLVHPVFEGVRVHGVASHPIPGGALLLLHGEHHVQVRPHLSDGVSHGPMVALFMY